MDWAQWAISRRVEPAVFAEIEALALANPWTADSFDTKPDRFAFSAWQDGVCGAFVYGIHVLDEAEIWRVATRPEYRRQGLARSFLLELTGWAREAGIGRVFLEVSSRNGPAVKLYRGAGFHISGARTGYYGPGEDALLLARVLDSQ